MTVTCPKGFTFFHHALPENPNLPSVSAFAECQTTGTPQICCLPSARPRALGKNLAHSMPGLYRVPAVGKAGHSAKCLLCRVLSQRHSAKPAHVPSTRARRAPPVRGADGVKSLGKGDMLPSASSRHSAKEKFCRVRGPGSRQSFFCRVLELRHSAKLVKKNFGPSNFFGLYLNLII